MSDVKLPNPQQMASGEATVDPLLEDGPTADKTATKDVSQSKEIPEEEEKKESSWWSGFLSDMRQPQLAWIKLLFFFQSASLVSLYPYLTIHMRSLGFSLQDAAIINAVIPLADILGPPLAGILADKIGNFRVFLSVTTLLNGCASLILLVIPSMSLQEDFDNENHCGNCTSQQQLEEDWRVSFWSCLTARFLLDLLRASSLMLFEGAVVVIIKQHGGDYGLQKFFGTAGAVTFGLLAGKMLDSTSLYSCLFYLYFGLRAATAVINLKLDLSFKPPAKKRLLKQATKVLLKPQVFSFLCAFFTCGLLWGFLETFLFWRLEDLGLSKLIMGATLAVGTVAGVPITVFSSSILRRLRPAGAALMALAAYAIRLTGYWLMDSNGSASTVGLALGLEALKPVCTTLIMIAAFTFVKDSSPLTAVATVEGVFGAAYFGVGRGIGGLAGGFIMGRKSEAFGIFAAVAAAAAVVYAVSLAVIWLVQKNSRRPVRSST